MSSHSDLPMKEGVAQKLSALIRGDLSREDASEWARPWITRLDDVSDLGVRHALEAIYAADSPSTDRRYLYAREDFEQWLSDLLKNE
jgi:hypothetical protein